jgi:hypothetical protein
MAGLAAKHEANYLCKGLPGSYVRLVQVAQNGLAFRRLKEAAHTFR